MTNDQGRLILRYQAQEEDIVFWNKGSFRAQSTDAAAAGVPIVQGRAISLGTLHPAEARDDPAHWCVEQEVIVDLTVNGEAHYGSPGGPTSVSCAD